MGAKTGERTSYLGRLWRALGWVENKLSQDVPDNIARCEFDCRKLECRQNEWETCKKRLRYNEQAK